MFMWREKSPTTLRGIIVSAAHVNLGGRQINDTAESEKQI